MAWFADLAGKAETLLNNIDEQTGAALRSHHAAKRGKTPERNDLGLQTRRPIRSKSPPKSKTFDELKDIKSFYSQINRSTSPKNLTRPNKYSDNVRQPKKPNLAPGSKLNSYNGRSAKIVVEEAGGSDETETLVNINCRRHSIPEDYKQMSESVTYRMQNLEVENAMLKNELKVANREVAEFLERIRQTETDLLKANDNLENYKAINKTLLEEKESLSTHLAQLERKHKELDSAEALRRDEMKQKLKDEVEMLRDAKMDLEERIHSLEIKEAEDATAYLKLEKDLRHAQSTIQDLQINLEKSTAECHRLEKDWETYKVRVKNMLTAKDNEIKMLQEGGNLTEDTKILMDQIDTLRQEREDLQDALDAARKDCSDLKAVISELEARAGAAERAAGGLRGCVREERAQRTRAEADAAALKKELKALQLEANTTIANLKTALREKENEINNLRESNQSIGTTASGALNVADYAASATEMDRHKIEYLTDMLVQRQTKVDSLMGENNMLRIQLDKLESKYKAELSSKINSSHVLNLDDHAKLRNNRARYAPSSALSRLSVRLGVAIKRYPIFRVFILAYMIGLHFWVMTVLFSSTPDIIPKLCLGLF
ncbi:golgin subfamily A member 5 isoform X1 [Plutella xylostella]|uniref:golgin subfamily A member 5 isoform X1 n=1 Tax=Plutella xylostella TaxID=51655 RepID=UPI0020328783|nr:golgin subfamily A member 5 isoform X1 [Plutella xylostella]